MSEDARLKTETLSMSQKVYAQLLLRCQKAFTLIVVTQPIETQILFATLNFMQKFQVYIRIRMIKMLTEHGSACIWRVGSEVSRFVVLNDDWYEIR